MTLWYDVSDVIHWRRPYVTGIQRVVVGVLGGLMTGGVPVRLVAFRPGHGFRAVELGDLPPAIRAGLPGGAAEHPVPAFASVLPAHPPAPAGPAGALLPGGADPRDDVHRAMADFVRAARSLQGATRRWIRARLLQASRLDRPEHAGPEVPGREAVPASPGPMSRGDELVSVGATWVFDSHAGAVAELRGQGVRVVRMIYDLIPTLKPEWVDDPARGVYPSRGITLWVRRVLMESDAVVTISEFSRREIFRYCAEAGLVPAPTSVVRLGDDLGILPEHPPLPRLVPARPFFLCVSTIDIRKNHRLLYDAWKVLAARDPVRCPDLVCVGMVHLFVKDLLREIRLCRDVNHRIHVMHDCADQELAWYFRHCAATIYPSRYEGWGLPVAESLGHGRLVLASDATSIPEIGGDLPAYFNPLDVHGLVSLVERTLSDPEWVRSRESAIRDRFRVTPWSMTANQVMQALAAASPCARAGDAGGA